MAEFNDASNDNEHCLRLLQQRPCELKSNDTEVQRLFALEKEFYHHATDAQSAQRFTDVLQLEGFDGCDDQFHEVPLSVCCRRSVDTAALQRTCRGEFDCWVQAELVKILAVLSKNA